MVGYLVNITDTNIYDSISVPILKNTNKQVTTISSYFSARITLNENFTIVFILPSNDATRVDLRFVANIGRLESSAS